MAGDISPPPTKRRKLAPAQAAAPTPPMLVSQETTSPTVRIFSWNVNGITPFLQTSLKSFFQSPTKGDQKEAEAPASLRDFLRRHDWPEMLCLQEIKIGREDVHVLSSLKQAVKSSPKRTDEPSYEVFTTLPNDKFNARGMGGKGRVYGVASIVRSDFYETYVANIRKVDWDAEGRFSIIEVEDPATNAKLSIWNVYAVNGTTNEWRDSKTGEVVGTRHDRKLMVHRLMMEECLQLENGGWDVVIIGDLNVAPARIDGHPNLRTFPEQHVTNRADFNKRFLAQHNTDGLRGVDVWRELRGTERKYSYHSRGRPWGSSCDRVDLAVASRRLLNEKRLVGCEIWDTEYERGPSDHCPISVDIKLERRVSVEKDKKAIRKADENERV